MNSEGLFGIFLNEDDDKQKADDDRNCDMIRSLRYAELYRGGRERGTWRIGSFGV